MMDIDTIEVPILGLDGHSSSVVIPDYGAPLGIPVPDDALEHLIITSTDSQGNCYVTLQESYATPQADLLQNVEVVSHVTRLPRNTLPPKARRILPKFRRTRMVCDALTSITAKEFKAQLKDTTDIIGRCDIAPATKAAMALKKSKGVAKTFGSPGRRIISSKLINMFHRHFTTRVMDVEETYTDMPLLPVGYQPQIDPSKIKRITRRRRYPEAEEYQRKLMEAQIQQTFDNLVAESQNSVESVFVEDPATLGDHQNNLEVLVEAAQNNTLPANELQTSLTDQSIDAEVPDTTFKSEELQEGFTGETPQTDFENEQMHEVFMDEESQGATLGDHKNNLEVLVEAAQNNTADELQTTLIDQNIEAEVSEITFKSEELKEGFTGETPQTDFENEEIHEVFLDEESQGDVDVFHSEEVIEGFEPGEDDSIIIIDNEEEIDEGAENECTTQQNIEVLLAASAGGEMDMDDLPEVIICDPTNSDMDSFFSDSNSIIIVSSESLVDTVTETVITS